MDDAARMKVGTWSEELTDAIERRLVDAGIRVVSDANRPHDWDIRVSGAVDGRDGVFFFTRATARIEYDGAVLDFAEVTASEPEPRRGHPDRVATLLLNTIGHAPHLVAHVTSQRAKALAAEKAAETADKVAVETPAPAPAPSAPVAPPSRPPRAASAATDGICRRQCRAGEALNAYGCCEKQ
jgi:hypothetical protein